MLKQILPIVLLLIGTGAGVGAGMALRPAPEAAAPQEAEAPKEAEPAEPYGPDNPAPMMEYAKLNNQFVVPIIKDREVAALVVLSLSMEVTEGNKDVVFQREPKLRDSFLGVLFDHANMGGFEGAFTDANNIAVLRNALREVAQKDMGKDVVSDVLILEIARQDY
ncbi:flagellar basal body-associated FliL family protein [Sulfitobacter sp. PS-8MA]|uniref:flagellar basal body-associated FliL family protein n=1 Tax=Sulfitobacter sp. PS-8MA TaxID=3237707 RepID=UPI0034C60D50